MSWRKNRYNRKSAQKYAWDPSWFGATSFDDHLIKNIKDFQKSNNLVVDGLCGEMTYRRAYTTRQMLQVPDEEVDYSDNDKFIYCDGYKKRIKWDKVKTSWLPDNCYKKQTKYRVPTMVVTHWDAALSAASCKRILEKRKISTHFVIDNDGTIYQTLDMQHGGWHAGSERVNRASVGVEISNAYYTKYQDWYERNGFGPRPLIDDAWVHGVKLKEHLDFYPVQIEALKALWKAIHKAAEIPYDTPKSQFGTTSTKYEQDVKYGAFSGFISHYHVSKNTIDCAGLDIVKLLEQVKDD